MLCSRSHVNTKNLKSEYNYIHKQSKAIGIAHFRPLLFPASDTDNPSMEDSGGDGSLPKPVAVLACIAMALFYVAILYAPTLVLRLPPPSSYKVFMTRRFICAAVSSIVSVFFCAFILPTRIRKASSLLGVFGIRMDHIWQAVVFPLLLSSLMYTGSLVLKTLLVVKKWKENTSQGQGLFCNSIKITLQTCPFRMLSAASNILFWRNFVMAPLTEELVFRACMIPLLLCGGFKVYAVMFLCPIFFSLAHLNHMMEIYRRYNYSLLKASMAIGLQLGYTVVFGSYASFLFIRTGHLVSPLATHIFCNYMGLPVIFVRSKGLVTVAFVAGTVAFVLLLFPMTQPYFYNDRTNNCGCWQGYCSWN